MEPILLYFISLLVTLILFQDMVSAEGLSGYLELNYNNLNTQTEDSAGNSSKVKTNLFSQRYNLSLQRSIYPNLRFIAGGIFEKDITDSDIDGQKTDFTSTNIRPFIDLVLRNEIFTAGAGYDKREEKQVVAGVSALTNISENYDAVLGWRPEGLPSVKIDLNRTNSYDKERTNRDTMENRVSVEVIYLPLDNISLRYQPEYTDTNDRLNDVETKVLSQRGFVSYTDSFFNRRVSLATSYNISHSEKEVSTESTTGEVLVQLFPFAGLSSIDDSPSEGELDLNSDLIDGNLATSAGLNLGVPPSGGNTDPRNIGLNLTTDTELNTLYIWVSTELPAQIVNAFSWDIYTSSDNLNWNILTTVSPASFGLFQNRFELNFQEVAARYIKVVVNPLELVDTIGVPGDFSNIFVTEVQAFTRKSAEDVKGKTTTTTNTYNADIRARLLDNPDLFYEFSYFLTETDPSSLKSSTLSNGFSLRHTFSNIFSGMARVAREDSVERDEEVTAYVYNASVTARPLSTLTHVFAYSGRNELIRDGSNVRNSFSLKNIAELYKGISVDAFGGLSFQELYTGEESKSIILNFGSSITPIESITLNLNYSDTNTETITVSDAEISTFSRRGTLSVAYRPYRTMYLFASLETLKKTDLTRTIQNYGANWSPFPDGSLQFNFLYNENLTSDNEKNRVLSPSVRWDINQRTFVNLAYQKFMIEGDSQTTDSDIISTALRMTF